MQRHYLNIQNAIDEDADIILSNGGLIGNWDSLLLQGVHVSDPLDQRDQEVDPGGESLHVLSEPLDDVCLLLGHNPYPPIDGGTCLVSTKLPPL